MSQEASGIGLCSWFSRVGSIVGSIVLTQAGSLKDLTEGSKQRGQQLVRIIGHCCLLVAGTKGIRVLVTEQNKYPVSPIVAVLWIALR